MKVKGKKNNSVNNLETFIFFFHFFHPTALEFESKGERRDCYCPKYVPWKAVCFREVDRVRSKSVRSLGKTSTPTNWAKKTPKKP